MKTQRKQLELFSERQSVQVINLIPHVVRRIFSERGQPRLRREGAVVQTETGAPREMMTPRRVQWPPLHRRSTSPTWA